MMMDADTGISKVGKSGKESEMEMRKFSEMK